MTTRMQAWAKAAMTTIPSFTPVRSGLLQCKCACGGTPGPTGECEKCRKKRPQRKAPQPSTLNPQPSEVPPIVHEVLRSPGLPLDSATRTFMESRLGRDFSHVRVHTDAKASHSAEAINALAYTVGRDVVFGSSQYAPQSNAGRRLLAHELVHTIQQRTASAVPQAIAPSDSGEEDTANRTAEALVDRSARTAAPYAPLSLMQVMRRPDSEGWASVHQRILKGMIELVKRYPEDGEERLDGLTTLLATVPNEQAARLYRRLKPGAKTDDFAQYFKNQFPKSRREGLAFLRQKFTGTRPPDQPSAEPSRAVEGERVGKAIAVAGCALPTKESGSPVIPFGRSMQGEGYLYNPKYWRVEYTLNKGGEKKTFSSSKAQPSAWRQTEQFLESNLAWHGSQLDVVVRVGQYGASAAINDVWNPSSASLYAIDCLAAANLIQLRGIYLSYPEAERDAAFDRDYSGFKMERFADPSKLPSSSLSADMDIVKLASPVPLADDTLYTTTLRPGDQIPVENRFMPPSSPWRTENVIYVGERKFFGHPLGVVTLQEYARRISRRIPAGYVDPQIGREPPTDPADLERFVLQHAYVASYERPRTRWVAPVTGPQTRPPK